MTHPVSARESFTLFFVLECVVGGATAAIVTKGGRTPSGPGAFWQ